MIPTEVDVEAHVAALYPPLPPPMPPELSPGCVVESDYHDALIPLDIDNPIEPRVNARDLHAFLGIGKDFSTWIKDLIEKHEFVEGEDFVIDSPNLGNQSGRGGDRRSKLTVSTPFEWLASPSIRLKEPFNGTVKVNGQVCVMEDDAFRIPLSALIQ